MLEFEYFSFVVPGKQNMLARGQVRTGEWVLLRGPSGCGKTTFLKSMAGFNPSEGRLKLFSVSISDLEAKDKNIGFVFQGSPLFEEFDVFENILLPLKVSPKAQDLLKEEKEALVEEMLIKFGIEHLRRHRTWELSGGERSRVALAQALILKPKLLLLDEPFASLDRTAKEAILQWFKEIVEREGLIVFLVTHSDEEALILEKKEILWPTQSSELVFS